MASEKGVLRMPVVHKSYLWVTILGTAKPDNRG